VRGREKPSAAEPQVLEAPPPVAALGFRLCSLRIGQAYGRILKLRRLRYAERS